MAILAMSFTSFRQLTTSWARVPTHSRSKRTFFPSLLEEVSKPVIKLIPAIKTIHLAGLHLIDDNTECDD